MIDFIKRWFNKSEEDHSKGEYLPPSPRVLDIGEPVLAIIEATRNPDRWEMGIDTSGDSWKYYHFKDNTTERKFTIGGYCSEEGPYSLRDCGWATQDEKGALLSAFTTLKNSLSEKIRLEKTLVKRMQDHKEREILMKVYCK